MKMNLIATGKRPSHEKSTHPVALRFINDFWSGWLGSSWQFSYVQVIIGSRKCEKSLALMDAALERTARVNNHWSYYQYQNVVITDLNFWSPGYPVVFARDLGFKGGDLILFLTQEMRLKWVDIRVMPIIDSATMLELKTAQTREYQHICEALPRGVIESNQFILRDFKRYGWSVSDGMAGCQLAAQDVVV